MIILMSKKNNKAPNESQVNINGSAGANDCVSINSENLILNDRINITSILRT